MQFSPWQEMAEHFSEICGNALPGPGNSDLQTRRVTVGKADAMF